MRTRTRLGEHPRLLDVTRQRPYRSPFLVDVLVPVPVYPPGCFPVGLQGAELVQVPGQVPHIPGVRAVFTQDGFLLGRGVQPVSGHATTVAGTTDIPGRRQRGTPPLPEGGGPLRAFLMAAQATSARSQAQRTQARAAAERPPRRRRDPDRKERILVAAAALGARRGFDAISMADIGAEAGIVGSGVYRHFDSKTAILVAMADRVMDRLMTGRPDHRGRADEGQSLTLLVRDHIEVALTDRDALAVYHREVRTLPEDERRRLSRAQRHYIEEWVHLLAPLRPDLADGEVRLAVHAAIGAIQSTLFFRSGLADERLTELLEGMAHGCLGTPVAGK